MTLPSVTPAPPLAVGVGLPSDVPVGDAVAVLADARETYGDTFVVESGSDRYLFVFSALGVQSFYALAEEDASKGLADYRMLQRKLPDEIFSGRRILPSSLFRRDDVASYLSNLERALDATISELGPSGSFDLFAVTRRIGHRMGLASWAGRASAEGETFNRLVAAFDTLDGADAFVHPDAMAAVAASDKAAERAALEEIVTIIASLADPGGDELFGRITAAWEGEPEPQRSRGIALDSALIHVASMSNLASALGWLLVDLISHPAVASAVAGGDRELAERCALESTRLAQRSIMPRYVLRPLDFVTEEATYRVEPGATIATLLPLLNTTARPGLAEWDPQRWTRMRLTAPPEPKELVTAFGHGRHSCPAQPFSLAAMSTAACRLLAEYVIEPAWNQAPSPVPAQIGGVARAAEPTPVTYRRSG